MSRETIALLIALAGTVISFGILAYDAAVGGMQEALGLPWRDHCMVAIFVMAITMALAMRVLRDEIKELRSKQ